MKLHLCLACLVALIRLTEQSRWGAMVINLKRRPDRLTHFAQALGQKQSWLLAGHHVCRIPGRDGHELEPGRAKHTVPGGHYLEPSRAKHNAAAGQRWGGQMVHRYFLGLDNSPFARNSTGAAKPSIDTANAAMRHMIGTSPSVPSDLTDTDSLVRSGWLTSSSLTTAFYHQKKAQWPTMTYGGMGLYFGHAAAWQYVVEQQLDYGLIFEDDLTLFAPNFEQDVRKILEDRNKEIVMWDFLYLQRCDDMDWEKERSWWMPGRAASHRTAAKSFAVPIADEQTVTCTGAYIITLNGAMKLLKGAFPMENQLDYQIGYVPGLRRAGLSPPVAQCAEIFQNAWGQKVRDTDVQKGAAAELQKDRLSLEHSTYNDQLAAEVMDTPVAHEFHESPQGAVKLRGHHKKSLVDKHQVEIPDCTM